MLFLSERLLKGLIAIEDEYDIAVAEEAYEDYVKRPKRTGLLRNLEELDLYELWSRDNSKV